MYKQNIANAQEKVINALNKGKEAFILAPLFKDGDILYPLGEHISIVKDIRVDEKNKGMSILTLQFKNKTADTHVYIKDDIKIGSVVSTIGFLTQNGLVSSYYTKGGISKVMNYLEEIPIDDVAPSKVFRLGVVLDLSEVNVQTKTYKKTDKNVNPLEDVTDIYYVIEERETPQNDTTTNLRNIYDKVRNGQPSTEDYPDVDFPTMPEL